MESGIHQQDYDFLRDAGVQGIYGPGANVVEAAADMLRLLGHNMPPVGGVRRDAMRYADKPDLPAWARLLLLILIAGGMIFGLGNLFVWFMGPCPAFSSNTTCKWSQARTLWLFPVSQIATVLLIALVVRLLRKWTTR